MTVEEWKNKITEAVRAEERTDIGPAGETPLTRIANEFESLSIIEANSAANAIVALVTCPSAPAETNPNHYWRAISFASQYLPNLEKGKLAIAFRRQLFAKETLDSSVRAHILNGLIAASGRLTPVELEELRLIRREHPIIWLNAAVASGFFELARKETTDALRCDRLDVNGLVLSLDKWRETWNGAEFGIIVSQFLEAATPGKPKQKLRAWMERRGFDPASEVATSMGGVDEFIRDLDSSSWSAPHLAAA